jgi:hypothetical protein
MTSGTVRPLSLPPRDLPEFQATACVEQGTTSWKQDYSRRGGCLRRRHGPQHSLWRHRAEQPLEGHLDVFPPGEGRPQLHP